MITCSGYCACRYCLYWWSSRCPYGECYDDHRAVADPYTDHYPERHSWSDSHNPGEQAHWCRGSAFYPADDCPEFVQYTGQNIETCYRSNIQVFQDGYRICSSMVKGSCEKCLQEMAEIIERRNEHETRRERTQASDEGAIAPGAGKQRCGG